MGKRLEKGKTRGLENYIPVACKTQGKTAEKRGESRDTAENQLFLPNGKFLPSHTFLRLFLIFFPQQSKFLPLPSFLLSAFLALSLHEQWLTVEISHKAFVEQ